MKRLRLISIIVTTMLLLVLACGPAKRVNDWASINAGNYTQVELYRDTVNIQQLDSICASHNINADLDDWSVMIYYNSKTDILNSYIYASGLDTLYTVYNYGDEDYIFTMRVNKYD